MANVVTRHFETLLLVYDKTYSNIQDLMSMPSVSLFQKLVHRELNYDFFKVLPYNQVIHLKMRAYYVFWLFLMIFFFKVSSPKLKKFYNKFVNMRANYVDMSVILRPDQIRLLMDIYTVYAKNPNKCFICLGAPWRFFLINSIMNFIVLNGNPMKRKQMKYFCDFEKKNWACSFFSC